MRIMRYSFILFVTNDADKQNTSSTNILKPELKCIFDFIDEKRNWKNLKHLSCTFYYECQNCPDCRFFPQTD